jgi:hypothetical protein
MNILIPIALGILVVWLILRALYIRQKRQDAINRAMSPRVQTACPEAMKALERQYEQQRQFEIDQVKEF